ncbi:hypothetical protein MLD38_035047 [Melastoma candidum]|uniref:Uncharacterized protein n=1 Tax=Melastoma candidum TaxID=119954 RepID=A0ACB9MBV8_9MYRT|nr:hypothetical protein MLD38_035047 [Melastoma candidum]
MTSSRKLPIPTFIAVLVLLQRYSLAARVPTSTGTEGGIWPRTTVVLINEVNDLLTLHCQSKEDDLGIHVVPKGESWQFSFDPNFFSSTLYFCSFHWGGEEARYFDAYKQSRDLGYKRIPWLVRTTGVCIDGLGGFTCYPWH